MAQENTLLSTPEAQQGLAPAQATRREPWLLRQARRLVVSRLEQLVEGSLVIHGNGETQRFGGRESDSLQGEISVHDSSFWERVAWGGSIGAGEAFCDGLWSTPDLTAVVRVLARNQEALDGLDSGAGALADPARRFLHRRRSNTRQGSIRNISAHYDTGNEFFARFLDPTLTYSCAIFPDSTSTLETAQEWKLDTICRKLDLQETDRLVEIGTGWGGLAIHAARNYGCRVVSTTISQEQFRYASQAVEDAGLADLIDVVQVDYRDLPSLGYERFDKLVSIEMIEAVGHSYLPKYFEVISELLEPDGLALVQAILIPDQRYEGYRRTVDFIQQYIFPGSLLPSMGRIMECTTGSTDLRLVDYDDLTLDYARTLAEWRRRFEANESEIAALGLTETERRKWLFYFGYCEGGFAERTVADAQLLFAKPANGRQSSTDDLYRKES